ncbi:hypothetical protein M094_2645 [Bacteroides uniformis str. 3978 T3 ii]|uniref:Uncharacterized protein n=1 Tax=Bacteroides uniformis str. 3978 T3 ii TaxID=1339349 RepID=A0A078RWY3_BACUN|nr:hypothetical protein M094_2645 [Bacteroides uniformis str. 3978 T3 ii]
MSIKKTAAKVEFSAERMKSFSTFCLSLCLQKIGKKIHG